MKRFLSILTVTMTAGVLVLSGCKKSNKKAPQARAKAPKAGKVAAKPVAATNGAWAVKAYEVVRLALAADDLAAAKKGATALAAQSKAQGTTAKSATDKTACAGMTTAANKLASAKDFAAARLAFGDLSKNVISYLSGAPTRSKGLTAYQCPMAKGYKKWVQADAKMANPYMGKRMLMCGGKTKLTP